MTPVLHLVDDDLGFRRALARLLRALGHTVQEYGSAQEFLAVPSPAAGCLLLDVHMPGLSGLDLQARLAPHADSLPVIFITGQGDIPMSVRAIRAGAEDFLTKPVGRVVLVEAIERALARAERARATQERQAARAQLLARLSAREHEVALLLARGWLNKQVAAALGTTERTVKAHRSRIMEKLAIRSAVELARLLDQA
ncbi:response regulator transcription factor [Pseudoduganella lutea]|uniref:Response regulator transcription factor n=1 Tax=Pseudoduganella lutea TaxID=321985 RepID=A0A4P6KT80_9BURK|nr:response regulator [Pseudoduganella lutea]QBE61937.1 response regulator transcription factor [Pseudoduganella lutea]